MTTYSPESQQRSPATWHVVDAEGHGPSAALPPRWPACSAVSTSRSSAPHIDTGDHVIIVNADKVVLTSGKADDQDGVQRHSGLPGWNLVVHLRARNSTANRPMPCGGRFGACSRRTGSVVSSSAS